MKLSNLIAALALGVGATPAAAQVCPYQNLMPEFSKFVAATSDLAPPARAERLFDPQRVPKFTGSRPITLDDVLATGRTITADYARIEGTFRKAFPDYAARSRSASASRSTSRWRKRRNNSRQDRQGESG